MPVSEQVVNDKSSITPAKSRGLFRSTSIVSGMTLLSRIMGFLRDMILAQIFAASPAFDAFIIALKLPNFMRRLFGEGAFSQAFVPVFAEVNTQGSLTDAQHFVSRVAGTLGLVVMIVVALAECFAPIIIRIFAPGFAVDGLRYQLTLHMLHITFPYLLLITLTAFSGAILNTCNRFAVPAFTPVLLNVALIAAAFWWAPHAAQPIMVLAWGLLLGGVLQLAMQLPALWRVKQLRRPRLGFRDPTVRRVMRLMVPALFGVSVAQVSLLIDNFFASFLPAGSISWLYYSDRLTYLPLGVIGVALATVVLPQLSKHHSSDSQAQYSVILDWALRCELLVGLPAAVALFLLSGPLLATLFCHGAFGTHDVWMTRQSLMAFSVGLPGFMLIKVLASAFYSRKNIRTPVKIAAMAVLVNVGLNLALILPLRHAGLALSTSLAAFFNAGLLLFVLLRRRFFLPAAGWGIFAGRLLLANAVMAVVLYWGSPLLVHWLQWTLGRRIEYLLGLMMLGLLSYVVALLLVGVRLKHIRSPELR